MKIGSERVSARDNKRNFPDEILVPHLDAILRASGSGLRFYSLHSVREAMFAALDKAMTAAAASNEVKK